MLIPRFSIRWLLGLTTASAAVSLVLAAAVRGRIWAVGLAAALASLVIVAAVHITAFLAAWLISAATAVVFRRDGSLAGSPFRADDRVSGLRPAASNDAEEGPPAITG